MQDNQLDAGGVLSVIAVIIIGIALFYMTYDLVIGVMQRLPVQLPWLRFFS